MQFRKPPSPRNIANRDGDRLLLTDQHDQLLAAGNASIEQISLQHGVVPRHDQDDHSRIFRVLAFVDGRGVGLRQRIEFAKSVGDGAAVEVGSNLTVVGINIR